MIMFCNDFLLDPFDAMAGWLQGHLLLPMLWHLGLSAWEDISYGWALVALYGVAQVFITLRLSMPAERFFPLERWKRSESVGTDIFYTLLNRVGVLPLVSFVLFYAVQTWMNGFLTDHGIMPPTIERAVPFLLGHPILTLIDLSRHPGFRRVLAPSPLPPLLLVVYAAFPASRAAADDLLVG